MMFLVHPTNRSSSFVAPVTEDDYEMLQALMKQNISSDYYQCSMAYFAITGRNGLWKAQRDNSFVLFCRHPNVQNCILVFPPVGLHGQNLLHVTVQTLMKMGDEIRFARFENDVMLRPFESHFIETEEEVLDWAYPVRTINTERVSNLHGKDFQHVRQKINHLDKNLITAEDLDPAKHYHIIQDILENWASADKHGIYFSLLKLFKDLPFCGRVIFYDGMPQAFTIWEEVDLQQKVANAYANISLYDHTGLSHYMIYDMCNVLYKKGVEKLCLGGSETEGLDRFKRKFCPEENAYLKSFSRRESKEKQKQISSVS